MKLTPLHIEALVFAEERPIRGCKIGEVNLRPVTRYPNHSELVVKASVALELEDAGLFRLASVERVVITDAGRRVLGEVRSSTPVDAGDTP